jgi:hypothetical protein
MSSSTLESSRYPRSARMAAAMSFAPKTLVPATSVSAPAAMLVAPVVALIPPSTSMR